MGRQQMPTHEMKSTKYYLPDAGSNLIIVELG
jgi:hypothetical protein